jgi:hypothetical protein
LDILGSVEKRHAARVGQVAAGLDPNKLTAAELREQRLQATRKARAQAEADASGLPESARRRDKTQRIGVVDWHPKRFEATPEGHFAHVMRTKDGTQPPQRRSFVHDPCVHACMRACGRARVRGVRVCAVVRDVVFVLQRLLRMRRLSPLHDAAGLPHHARPATASLTQQMVSVTQQYSRRRTRYRSRVSKVIHGDEYGCVLVASLLSRRT